MSFSCAKHPWVGLKDFETCQVCAMEGKEYGDRVKVALSKYDRPCKGITIDVYDVLQAFNVTNPALQHLIKKALCMGLRGHKDRLQDVKEVLESAKRAVELEETK